MIIFVTTTKPFKSIFTNIQKNALNSWNKLNIEKKILVLTTEEECINFCQENGFIAITEFENSDISGIPTYRSLIESAKNFASDSDIICQINCDIILCNDFTETIKSFSSKCNFEKFALVGQRFDCQFTNELIDFSNSEWESNLPDGEWHPGCGMDYFVISKSTFNELPKFFVARFTYDGWIMGHIKSMNIPMFDCTQTIKAYHQNHGYGTDGNMSYDDFVSNNQSEISVNSQFSHSLNIERLNGKSKFENGEIVFTL